MRLPVCRRCMFTCMLLTFLRKTSETPQAFAGIYCSDVSLQELSSTMWTYLAQSSSVVNGRFDSVYTVLMSFFSTSFASSCHFKTRHIISDLAPLRNPSHPVSQGGPGSIIVCAFFWKVCQYEAIQSLVNACMSILAIASCQETWCLFMSGWHT